MYEIIKFYFKTYTFHWVLIGQIQDRLNSPKFKQKKKHGIFRSFTGESAFSILSGARNFSYWFSRIRYSRFSLPASWVSMVTHVGGFQESIRNPCVGYGGDVPSTGRSRSFALEFKFYEWKQSRCRNYDLQHINLKENTRRSLPAKFFCFFFFFNHLSWGIF